ncbi:hypothetical protein PV341_11135, partial [Streptomyces sp. PA03-1a]|nr:hypothetical protein [Streptomyces sp. PA03-1a]
MQVPQGVAQGAHAQEPLLGLLGQRAEHHGVDGAGQLRAQCRGRHRVLGEVLVHHRERRVTGEGRPAGEQLVEQAPQRVLVGARVHRRAVDLLRREVGGRPHGHPGRGQPGRRVGDDLGDAEVEDLDLAVSRDHHVGRFDVAVDQPLRMAVGQGVGDVPHDRRRALHREGTVAQHLGERAPLDELHDEVGDDLLAAGVLTDVVEHRDPPVGERGDRTGLPAESGPELLVPGQLRGQHLDRHGTAELTVDPAPDLAHAAPAHGLHQLVPPRQHTHGVPPAPF